MTLSELNQHFELIEKLARAREMLQSFLEEEVKASEGQIMPFIQGIDDDQTRLIFRLRFLRGLAWKEVAAVIGGRNSEDSVKMVCYRYLGS